MRKALVAFCILAVVTMVSYGFLPVDDIGPEQGSSRKEIIIIRQDKSPKAERIYEQAQGDGDHITKAVGAIEARHDVPDHQKNDFLRSVPKIELFDTANGNWFVKCDRATCIGRLVFRNDASRVEMEQFVSEMQSLEYMYPNDREVYWVLDSQFGLNKENNQKYVTITFEKK